MMNLKMLLSLTLCLILAACGGQSDTGAGNNAPQANTPSSAVTMTPKSTSFIKANLSGARPGELQGNTALSGAEYGRYHLNFAGTLDGHPGTVVVAFARDDTSSPAAGTYALGADADFNGTVEFYDDDSSFGITTGELILSNAHGDSLSGSFSLSAEERGGDAIIEAEGSFQTRAAK